MSVHVAYIFPNILPQDDLVFSLTQLFTQLLFLRPVEDDLPKADTPLLQALENQEESTTLIAFPCPAPLAKDRERFLGLLQDIDSRPQDYAGHLSNLSAGAPVAPEHEQEHAIVDTLLHQTGIQTASEQTSGQHTPESANRQGKNASSVLLWQARLLLKLGESLDKQQADIRNNLVKMSQQQEALLRELRKEQREGEEGIVDVDLSGIIPSNPRDDIPVEQERLRLKAWSRLFFLSTSTFEHTAFISQSSDAIEALLEYYQQTKATTGTGQTVKQILCLPLPTLPTLSVRSAFIAEKKEEEEILALLAQRDHFQQEASTLLAHIRSSLKSPKKLTATAEQEWIDLLDRHYPTAHNQRCTLTLYFLPEISPRQLFVETFIAQDSLTASPGAGVILGLLDC